MWEFEPGTLLEFNYGKCSATVRYDFDEYLNVEELTMDWASKKFIIPYGYDPEDVIIETEVDGHPCYIKVYEHDLPAEKGYTTEYTIYQEIADGTVLSIDLDIYSQPERLNYDVEIFRDNGTHWYWKEICNKEAHLLRVLPYLITQDRIQ